MIGQIKWRAALPIASGIALWLFAVGNVCFWLNTGHVIGRRGLTTTAAGAGFYLSFGTNLIIATLGTLLFIFWLRERIRRRRGGADPTAPRGARESLGTILSEGLDQRKGKER